MTALRMAAACAAFGRDVDDDLARVGALIGQARAGGVGLLVLPEACLGGYLTDLGGTAELPPALTVDGPEIAALAALAGDMVMRRVLRSRRRRGLQQRRLRRR